MQIKIAYVSQRLVNNPRKFFGHFDYVSARIEVQSTSFHQLINPPPALTISPEITATMTATVMAAVRNQK